MDIFRACCLAQNRILLLLDQFNQALSLHQIIDFDIVSVYTISL